MAKARGVRANGGDPARRGREVKRLLTFLAAAALATVPAVTGLLGNPSFTTRSPLSGPSGRPPGTLPDRLVSSVVPSAATTRPGEGGGAHGADR